MEGLPVGGEARLGGCGTDTLDELPLDESPVGGEVWGGE